MIKKNIHTKEQEALTKESVVAAIIAAFVQHGTIQRKHPKQNIVKKESEWKKEANKWVTLNRGEYLVTISNVIYKVSIADEKNVIVNDIAYTIDLKKVDDDVYKFTMSGFHCEIEFSGFNTKKSPTNLSSELSIKVNGILLQAIVDDQRSLVAQSWSRRKPHISKPNTLRAPMPGLVTKIMVQQGEIVQRGGVLLVLEAMKMENEIRALQKCKIESVSIQPGATVERNEELLKIIEI